MRWLGSSLLFVALVLPRAAHGDPSIAGICPDGSVFVVHSPRDIPCSRAKLVEPSSIPPLRPELLPQPYPWLVDQQARNPNNPYNLLEAAEKIRSARTSAESAGATEGAAPESTAPPRAAHSAPPSRASSSVPPEPQRTGAAAPVLIPEEIEALVELVELRQQLAPARLRAEDALGNGRMEVSFAYSRALEERVLSWLGEGRGGGRVILFAVRALEAGEFHPSFFFLQQAQGFRPDPEMVEQVGLLLGDPGPLDTGATRLGYVVLPGRFMLEQPLELWWNDRRVEATLEPSA
jgi:hypothetical protein